MRSAGVAQCVALMGLWGKGQVVRCISEGGCPDGCLATRHG